MILIDETNKSRICNNVNQNIQEVSFDYNNYKTTIYIFPRTELNMNINNNTLNINNIHRYFLIISIIISMN